MKKSDALRKEAELRDLVEGSKPEPKTVMVELLVSDAEKIIEFDNECLFIINDLPTRNIAEKCRAALKDAQK